MVVSLTAVGIGVLVGGTLGMTAGFLRGWFDTVLMAAVNVVLAFPGLVLLLVLLAYVGQSLGVISLVIGFLSIPAYARVPRANTLAVDRKSVVSGKSVSVRVDLVGRRILKKKIIQLLIIFIF